VGKGDGGARGRVTGRGDKAAGVHGCLVHGLLYGPLAAKIITDGILGRENRWESIYRSTRFTPVKGAEKFVKENVDVAKQYVRDYLTRAGKEALRDVPLGGGKVVEIEGKRVAVYRDEQDGWSAVSPVCTHLGCVVHWNGMERSWDCPCHGSRFAPDGSVIEGPALTPLARKELRLTES
jgi:Rieske Fe-S protein